MCRVWEGTCMECGKDDEFQVFVEHGPYYGATLQGALPRAHASYLVECVTADCNTTHAVDC